MYDETAQRKLKKGFKSFLIIIILVYGILAVMLGVGFIQTQLGINYLQYILIAALIATGILIVRSLFAKYRYTVDENGVEILRQFGSKSKRVLFMPHQSITGFGRRHAIQEIAAGMKKRKYAFKQENDFSFYIFFADEVVVIETTEQFEEKLREYYGNTNR